MKTLLLLFLSCYCTLAVCQTELEEIRENAYGTDGVVDLYAMGFEDCDLIEVDEFNNQYVIDYNNSTKTINIVKLQENGEQVMDYGTNGELTIDSVFVQRIMNAKTYGDKLYLLADDQDTMFLYAFTSDGVADPSFAQGERAVATNVPANYHNFFLDIIDDVIMVGVGQTPFPFDAYYVVVDQFSPAGVSLGTNTITLTNHPEASVVDIQFRPSNEMYLVYGEREPIDSHYIKVRRYHNITSLDSSFATNGTYSTSHQNFNNFNLFVQEDQLTISYLLDTFFIKHERLNLAGDIIYEHTAPKIETLNPDFLFMERLGMDFTDDGYFVMERFYHQNASTDYYLTKYNSDLELDVAFGQGGSYSIDRIPRWRAVDALGRIYITLRYFGALSLIRTGPNEVNAVEEPEDEEDRFKVYPNPTNSIVNVQVESLRQEDVICKIFDLGGHLVFSQSYPHASFELDFSAFAEGVYLIQLVTSSTSTSQFVLKN